jgi:protein-S-isoprenylcysteine O-methyltransferase Ste14
MLAFLAGVCLLAAADLAVLARPIPHPVKVLRPADARLAWATGLVLLAVLWTALIGASMRPAVAVSWGAVGGGLMVAGAMLRYSAIRTLGGHFVTEIAVAEGQPLVTTGPYALARHPSELGLLISVAGGCALLRSGAAALLGLGVLLPLVAWRIRREERVLRQAFGPAWERWAREVGALWPSLRGRASR